MPPGRDLQATPAGDTAVSGDGDAQYTVATALCGLMTELSSLFSATGPLASAVPGYRPRVQQLEMAQAVARAIELHNVLVAEAGTGTGKTFAYLVPALVSGGKVIISTGTKTLQDQLFTKDLPTVRDALRVPVTVALLKGRANYVCHHHLERAKSEGRFATRDDARHLPVIVRFARTSGSGDKAECSGVPDNAGIWSWVTSTRENCLGSECTHYKEDCFVMEARKRAMSADVVVVNHHLFFADVVLRDEGVAELLPACSTVIFDEAHQLPDTASVFYGESVSTSQLIELARDSRLEGVASAADFSPQLNPAAQALDKAARDLRLVFERPEGRLPIAAVEREDRFAAALTEALGKLQELCVLLESQADRSDGFERCFLRAKELGARIEQWRQGFDAEYVRWVELFSHSLQLNATPLSVAEVFKRQLEGHPRAWIFTSATLSVRGDFRHYVDEMGLGAGETAVWDSPFDYASQSLLYVPEGLPEPNSEGYTKAVVTAALPLIRAAGGRTFCLFTSLRAMRAAHDMLKETFRREGLDFPLLVQGDGPKNELLERFRKLGNAVLLGSQTFWEGVDVRGPALSVVAVSLLPISPPDDPVLAARIDWLNRQGRNAFMDYQVPEAVITLKQGAGRLIRDETDRGVLMICDPRLISKPYGRRIWQSLPPMRRTRSEAEATAFFEAAAALPQPS
jgi:ATP-dependent DNA helicase DinG